MQTSQNFSKYSFGKEEVENLSQISSSKNDISLTRFWRVFLPSDFESGFQHIATGNFGSVKQVTFKKTLSNSSHIFAGKNVALKEPKHRKSNFVEEQDSFSYEISCTLILHPNIVNYIGGVGLYFPERIGIIMELLQTNLRDFISKNVIEMNFQLYIAKQIASGMNFLHSLNPHVLHRDLRTPNILINADLTCKIGDFGLASNVIYEDFKTSLLYSLIIPPECINNHNNFTKKGDVYFFGWILIEMYINKAPGQYRIDQLDCYLPSNPTLDKKYTELIRNCLKEDPKSRLNFQAILEILVNISRTDLFDQEVICQNNWMDLLKSGITYGCISPHATHDGLKRSLAHQCAIFGNLEMLDYLVTIWGVKVLFELDEFNTSLTHIAARNGHLKILEYLNSYCCLSFEKESRFEVSPLDLAIAMKHWDCVEFLIPLANQSSLNAAFLSASSEGNLELVKRLYAQGASLESRTLDTSSTPLDRASYDGHLEIVQFLLEKGSSANQLRTNGTTPLFVASLNGNLEVVKLLLQHGADINKIRDDLGTPLSIASYKGHDKVVQVLLENGAKGIDYAITFAIRENHQQVVNLLEKYKAIQQK